MTDAEGSPMSSIPGGSRAGAPWTRRGARRAGRARPLAACGVLLVPAIALASPVVARADDGANASNASLAAASAGAPAPSREADDPKMQPIVLERRNGIVLGVAPGIAFGAASGYPNSDKFIGQPGYYSSTPVLVGTSTSFFLMGALTDYVSFGPMVNVASFENDKWKSSGFGIGFRIEAFPLVRLFPKLADTSVYTQLGVGSTEVAAKGPYPSSDGTQSFVGVGLHHEFRLTRMLGGHASAGPFVEYDAIFSTASESHWASAGLRVVWYGGTVTADR